MATITRQLRGWMKRSWSNVERDPEIDVFRTIYQKEHLKERDLAMLAGLSPSTVTKMFDVGGTRNPQHRTFKKMATAMGYKYGLVREGDAPEYGKEIPRAQEEYKAHQDMLRKKREREERRRKNGKGG